MNPNDLRPSATDLFGDTVVTEEDLFDWVSAVAPVWLSDRSFENYVRMYDVAGKIKAAKLRGSFESITSKPARPYHARLALSRVI